MAGNLFLRGLDAVDGVDDASKCSAEPGLEQDDRRCRSQCRQGKNKSVGSCWCWHRAHAEKLMASVPCSWWTCQHIFCIFISRSSQELPPRACQASAFFDPVCRRCETRIPSPRHISCRFFHSQDGAPIFVPTASLSVSLDQPTRFGTSSIDSIDHHLVVTAAFLTVDPLARDSPDQLFFGKFEQFSARPFGIVQKKLFGGIPFGRTLHSPRVCIYIQYILIWDQCRFASIAAENNPAAINA